MKTIIIDDDTSSIETLTIKLEKYPQLELCGTANTCCSGIRLASEVNPEVIFLDVELPDMPGLELLTQLNHIVRGWCQVIMYTGHPGYMLSAFRLDVFDYLMKPVDDRELRNVMNRLTKKRETEVSPLHQSTEANLHNKLLLYTNAADFRLTQLHDICAFQYNHETRQWEVIIAGQQEPVKIKRNASCDNILDTDPRFVQVSQKYIVNIDYLVEVSDNTCVFYPPFERITHIKVGRMYRKKLKERFNSL